MKMFLNRNILAVIACAILLIACDKSADQNSSSEHIGTGGSMARFTIVGDYMYTVDHQHLKAYSIADPTSPKLLSSQNVGWDIETIYPYDGSLFIGSMNAMFIFGLESPDKPVKKGVASHVRACDPVVVSDNHAYVTVRSGAQCGGVVNALIIYDVSNLMKPLQIGTVSLKDPHGLGIKGTTLYICDGNSGLKVFDISIPNNPALLTYREGHNYIDCITYDNKLICMVKNGLVIYDISDANNPIILDQKTN